MTDITQNFGQMGVSEEQVDLLDVATNFCRERSPVDKVRTLMTDELGFDSDIWKEIGDLGWCAIAIPEQYDGVGLSMAEVVPVMEQMGRNLMAGPFMSSTLAAQALLAGGTESQKSELLPKIAAGAVASLALNEKSGDWNLEHIAAKATKDGNLYKLTGMKTLVQDLPSAEFALVSVLIEGKPGLVIVNVSDISEAAIRRENLIDETKRAYEFNLDGLTVAADAILDMNKATTCFAHIHLCANLLSAAELCGGTQATIDYTIEYLNTRKQFGKLIGSYQALKHTTVDAAVDYEKARSLLYSAAFSFNEQGRGEIATRMAKAQAVTAMSFAADRAIQFHGGFGFTYDCDAQLYRRRAIFNASQYGDARYHKRKLAELLF
ncbi:MAG: acyl-CoA dehydrogenase [Acidimicrobiales bacterium]|nr:acyl-CoA/acyl-ACP dehydrogenase [Hyphomonadaceae bacterium]RZV44203.1 MAG: acyl-CoA dehydrogenase [Acidimicrobiales bacterium]